MQFQFGALDRGSWLASPSSVPEKTIYDPPPTIYLISPTGGSCRGVPLYIQITI